MSRRVWWQYGGFTAVVAAALAFLPLVLLTPSRRPGVASQALAAVWAWAGYLAMGAWYSRHRAAFDERRAGAWRGTVMVAIFIAAAVPMAKVYG